MEADFWRRYSDDERGGIRILSRLQSACMHRETDARLPLEYKAIFEMDRQWRSWERQACTDLETEALDQRMISALIAKIACPQPGLQKFALPLRVLRNLCIDSQYYLRVRNRTKGCERQFSIIQPNPFLRKRCRMRNRTKASERQSFLTHPAPLLLKRLGEKQAGG